MTHYDIAYIHTPPSFWLIFGILFLSVLFFFGCILYCAVTCLLRCCCHNTSVTVNKNKNIYGSIAEPRQLQEYELYQYSVEQHHIEPSAPMLPEASYWDGGNSDSNILTAAISPPLQHVDETPKFKDIWAALLFFANISFVCAFAIHVYFQSLANGSEKVFMSQFQFDSISNLDMIAYSSFVVGIPFFLGFSWLSFAIYHAETIIDSMMWFAILCNAVLALLCLLSGQIIGFIVMCIMCAGSIFYRYYVQNRIPFASSVLNVACASIQQHYSAIMIIVVLLCFLQLLWFILWAIASLAGITTIDDNSAVEQQSPAFTYPNKLVVFLLLLSLFWGLQLGYAILETTTSGVVACWWFQPNQKHPVRGSLFRAMTYSFGSLCFGSLIVSTVMASRDLLRMLRRRSGRQSGNIVLSIFFAAVDYILSLVESAAQYFNKYAYCYVAAYGHDFMTSGHLVMKLFHKRYFHKLFCIIIY